MILVNTILIKFLEGLSFGDSLWLSLTTVTTVGYGDVSAQTLWGRLSTILLLYGGGIFLLAKLSGDFFEIKSDRIKKRELGRWRVDMEDHIIIINDDENKERGRNHLLNILQAIKKSEYINENKIAIVSSSFNDGLGSEFDKYSNIVLFSEDPWVVGSIFSASLTKAKIVIINSPNIDNTHSDSLVFDAISRIRDANKKCFIVAECINEDNRNRVIKFGADVAVRPSRSFPEIIIRAIETPGSEKIIEHFVTAYQDRYTRIDLDAEVNIIWSDVVMMLIKENAGLPVAFLQDGKVISNPLANEMVSMTSMYIMNDKNQKVDKRAISKMLLNFNK